MGARGILSMLSSGFFLSVRLFSICMYICLLSICIFVRYPVFLSVWFALSVYLSSISLCYYLFVFLSILLPVCLSVCLFYLYFCICLSFCLFFSLSVFLSVFFPVVPPLYTPEYLMKPASLFMLGLLYFNRLAALKC